MTKNTLIVYKINMRLGLSIRSWKYLLLIGDAILVAIAIYAGLLLRFGPESIYFVRVWTPFKVFTGATLGSYLVTMFALWIGELYHAYINVSAGRMIVRMLLTLTISSLILSAGFYWLPHYRMYRLANIYTLIITATLLIAWRLLFFRVFFVNLSRRRLMLAGSGPMTDLLARTIREKVDTLYEAVGIIRLHEGQEIKEADMPVITDTDNLPDAVKRANASMIAVATRTNISDKAMKALWECKIKGIEIRDAMDLYKEIAECVPILHVDESWFLFGPDFTLVSNIWMRRFQRVFDIAVSVIGLILGAPLMILIALAVRLDSEGPVLFSQERVGLNEQIYTLYKFRTMKKDAEKETGAVWATRNDSRVTRVGRFLRRSRLDELPQLWNVLIGDMSFIGPRPEREEFVKDLKKTIPYYFLRFLVKPGLTGWAQVKYGYGSSKEDALKKLQYDLYYLQEMSVGLNLLILLKTIQTVLFRPGS